MNGRLPTSTPTLTGLCPILSIVTVYFPVISGLNVVKNPPVNSLFVIMIPFGFHTVSLKLLFGIGPTAAVALLRSTCIANDIGLEVSITWVDAFTEPLGLIEAPLRMVFSRRIVPAKGTVQNTETTIPEISKAAPTISIM